MPIPLVYSLGQIADLLSSQTAFSGMPRSLALRVVEDMAMCEYKTGDLRTQEGADNRDHLIGEVGLWTASRTLPPAPPLHPCIWLF